MVSGMKGLREGGAFFKGYGRSMYCFFSFFVF